MRHAGVMSQPFRLSEDLFLHLTEGLEMRVVAGTPDFWQYRERPELATGQLVSVFSYDSTWDFEERHPNGDELALVLDGDVDLVLRTDREERSVHLDVGQACVIPAGAWHHAEVHQPSTLFFITPVPALTEHRQLRTASSA
jgi:mannose-6-phosphate isomerase-like protein (cupin superfamily)